MNLHAEDDHLFIHTCLMTDEGREVKEKSRQDKLVASSESKYSRTRLSASPREFVV